MYFSLQLLKTQLPQVPVKGFPSIVRGVINTSKNNTYDLLLEGYGLLGVMGTPGVDYKSTKSNHILEMENVLGI